MTSTRTPGGGDSTGAAVRVVLRAPDGLHPRGWPVPIAVEIRNVSDADVWMVGVLDGSEGSVRYPHYLPTVMRDGVSVASPGAAEDPLVARLRVADIRRLAPGAAFDPTSRDDGPAYRQLSTFASWACPQPGDYQYALEVSTASDSAEQWLGRVGPLDDLEHLYELIARVPRLRITSNVLTVHVS